MKITKLNNLNTIINQTQPLACIWGFFDGWHLGHQLLIKTLITTAKAQGYQTLVISFKQKPLGVLQQKAESVLFDYKSKINFLISQHIDYYWEIDFTTQIAVISATQFLDWLQQNQIKVIVTNQSLTFGHNREGNYQTLLQYPFQIIVCPDVIDQNGSKITTTYLKQQLTQHDIPTVNRCLNNIYTITGVVVNGIKLGRKLGFPTANLTLNANYFLPGLGIYLTRTLVDTIWHDSITLIIIRNQKPLVETYLLDFNRNIYGFTIKIAFYQFLRPNQQFTNEQTLIQQIKADVEIARTFFKQLAPLN